MLHHVYAHVNGLPLADVGCSIRKKLVPFELAGKAAANVHLNEPGLENGLKRQCAPSSNEEGTIAAPPVRASAKEPGSAVVLQEKSLNTDSSAQQPAEKARRPASPDAGALPTMPAADVQAKAHRQADVSQPLVPVNSRIKVFWQDDAQWYVGSVTGYHGDRAQGAHLAASSQRIKASSLIVAVEFLQQEPCISLEESKAAVEAVPHALCASACMLSRLRLICMSRCKSCAPACTHHARSYALRKWCSPAYHASCTTYHPVHLSEQSVTVLRMN